MKFKFSMKLTIISLIGNIIMAIGGATCRISHLGIDPFTSMTTGLSSICNISLGVFQGGFNIILFLILILLNKKNVKYLNVGAFINMFLMGFFIQFFNNGYCYIFNAKTPENILFPFWVEIIILIIGIILITIGCSLYITSDLGTGCYDALSIYMAEEIPFSYAICRIMTDCICVITGFISGGPVGIATIFFMFGTGPLIELWNKWISVPIVSKYKKI